MTLLFHFCQFLSVFFFCIHIFDVVEWAISTWYLVDPVKVLDPPLIFSCYKRISMFFAVVFCSRLTFLFKIYFYLLSDFRCCFNFVRTKLEW